MSAPRAPGHLEWRTADFQGAEVIARLAAGDQLVVRAVERRGHAIAYAKSKATIRELLVHMGAHDAALSFEEADVISETRARANRNTNWDEANLGRMSEASRAQRSAIAQLDLDTLDPRLQQVARLRLRHADLSLTELGQEGQPAAFEVGRGPPHAHADVPGTSVIPRPVVNLGRTYTLQFAKESLRRGARPKPRCAHTGFQCFAGDRHPLRDGT